MALAVPNEFKAQVCEHYVNTILMSGLLTDEDVNNIIAFDQTYIVDKNVSLVEKIVIAMSASGGVITLGLKSPLFYTMLVSAPVMVIGMKKLSNLFYVNHHRQNIVNLIEVLRNTSSLNFKVISYFEMKKKMNASITHVINPYNIRFKHFLETVYNEECEVLKAFIGFINKCGVSIPWVVSKYEYIINFDFNYFSLTDLKDICDCIRISRNFYDAYVLLASNFLCCLAAILCPNITKERGFNIEEMLDTDVHNILKLCSNSYKILNKNFDDVKYSELHKNEIKRFLKPKANFGSMLESNSHNMMKNMAGMLEVTQHIYKMILPYKQKKLQNIHLCLNQLLHQASDFHESLQILIAQYERKINNLKPKNLEKPKDSLEAPVEVLSSYDPHMVSESDADETTIDDEYVLYIGPGDDPKVGPIHGYSLVDIEKVQEWTKTLGKELKLKVRMHKDFIAARRRRGSVVDEEDEAPPQQLELLDDTEVEFPEIFGPNGEWVRIWPSQEFTPSPPKANEIPLPPPPPPGPFLDDWTTPTASASNPPFLESIQTKSQEYEREVQIFQFDTDSELEDF